MYRIVVLYASILLFYSIAEHYIGHWMCARYQFYIFQAWHGAGTRATAVTL